MATAHEITRMSGLVSGLDVESLVKAASMNTKTAIDSRKQKLQTLQWKQEGYRNIIDALTSFQDKYLKIDSKTSIRANAVMKSNKAVSSDDKMSVAASASATAGKYTISSVKQAESAVIKGTAATAGTVSLDFSKAKEGKNTVDVTLDGTKKTIEFQGGADAKENFLTELNKAFSSASSAQFSFKDGTNQLFIDNAEGDKVSHRFTVGYSDSVGLASEASNAIYTTSKLGTVDFLQGLQGNNFEFSINGVDFKFDKNTTIKDMMNTINKSDAGVTMSLNTLSQTFEIKSNATGAGQEVELSQKNGNLLNALFGFDSDRLGNAPTKSARLFEKDVDNSVELTLTSSVTGLAKGDKITVNGKTLGITGISESQETEEITIDGNKVKALKYKDNDGNTVYSYKRDDGTKSYVKKNGSGEYDDLFSIGKDGKVVGDDNGTTEEEKLAAENITKDMTTYTAKQFEDALNDAYKASFKGDDVDGMFSVSKEDGSDELIIKFNADPDKAVSLSASGSGVSGEVQNYVEHASDADRVLSSGPMTFIVNGSQEITVGSEENGTTIADLTAAIDGKSYFSYVNGELTVNGTDRLQFTDGANEIYSLFGTADLYGKDNVGNMKEHGSNAQMTINGVTLESASNVFEVEGTTFGIEDVKAFSQEDVAAGRAEEITVNVSKDTSKIKETILGFVEEYNKLLDTLHETLNTTRPKDGKSYYDPLTDDQKDEMDEKEIEKWEEKAKTGLLYHDSTLTRVFNDIRSAVGTASVGGMTLQALGIDTSSKMSEYGRLVIKDESALDAAIERYGDEIANFFTDTKDGLATKLNNAVNSAIDTNTQNGFPKGSLAAMAGVKNTRSESKNLIYTQLTNLQTIIDKLNDRYESERERLWKRFSSLETYISNMNNQSMSLFGSSLYGQQQQQ